MGNIEGLDALQAMLARSRRMVFFGGAGVSTESGIPDFRSTDGLYHQAYRYNPEEILSHPFFERNPQEFYRFYRDKMLCLTARPNAAHRKLAQLESAGVCSAVVTQNIDGLHQAAGSRTVWELHGSIHRNYCMRCHRQYRAEQVQQMQGAPRGGGRHIQGGSADCGRHLPGGVSRSRTGGLFSGGSSGFDQSICHSIRFQGGFNSPGEDWRGVGQDLRTMLAPALPV